jgi:HD domain-containing protein
MLAGELDNWSVIMRELSLARSTGDFVRAVEQLAVEFTAFSEAAFAPFDQSQVELAIREDCGLSEDLADLARECALHCELQTSQAKDGSHSMAIPVRHLGALTGVLVLNGAPCPQADQRTRQRISLFVDIVGVSQEHSKVKDDLRRLLANTEELAVKAVTSNRGHVARVAQLCSELSIQLDLSAQVRQRLWSASQFHDVGEVLLRGQAAETVRKYHSKAGTQFLRCCSQLEPLASLVESHHERYDGSGFPQQKRGSDLRLENWVLALAEDIDEFWQEHSDMTFAERLALFFGKKAPLHHPAVVDGLSGLADTGRLKEIFGDR